MLELKTQKDFFSRISNKPNNLFIIYIYKSSPCFSILDKIKTFLHSYQEYGIYLYGINHLTQKNLFNLLDITSYPIIRIYKNNQLWYRNNG